MSLRSQLVLPWCAAFVMAGASVAAAQSSPASGQNDAASEQTSAASPSAGEPKVGDTITVTGCLATETDALGRRGLAVGEDELVLTELETEAAGAVGTTGETVGRGGLETARRAADGMYVLTGEREDELESLAGKRVEITGRLTRQASTYRTMPDTPDPAGTQGEGTSGSAGDETGAQDTEAGATNTGSTRGMEPGIAGARGPDNRAGIEAARRADALPEIEITSFREVEGSCLSVK